MANSSDRLGEEKNYGSLCLQYSSHAFTNFVLASLQGQITFMLAISNSIF